MKVNFSEIVDQAINKSKALALKYNHEYYTPVHFLLSLVEMEDTISNKYLQHLKEKLKKQLKNIDAIGQGSHVESNPDMRKWVQYARGFVSNENRVVVRENDMLRFTDKVFKGVTVDEEILNKVPLPNYLENLNQQLRESTIKPVWVNEDALETVMEVLQKQGVKNPLIVGERGIGKTSLMVALAQKIERGEVPLFFKNKKVYRLNLKSFLIGVKNQLHFEEKMDNLVKFFKHESDSGVLFIDNFENLPETIEKDSRMVSLNILKLALEQGEINCVGATSLESYNRYIRNDRDFDKLFPVMLNELELDKLKKVMEVKVKQLEHFHGVNISKSVIEDTLEMTSKYSPMTRQPLNAINILDSSASKLKHQKLLKESSLEKYKNTLEENKEQYSLYNKNLMGEENKVSFKKYPYNLSINQVAEVVSELSQVPVEKILQKEQLNILTLAQDIKENVFGQDEHIDKIADTLASSYAGLADESRPLGSFILFGPSGCGKTETAKVLSQLLFGGEENLIRFDLSEYSESHSVAKLIGPPAGYVGYEEGGQLTNAVRTKPYSVVLFDEVEKAHKNFTDIMLQMLDDGRLTDNKGITTNFKNTIIIMTSNSKNPDEDFKPEVLGRFNQRLNFNVLDPRVMKFLVKKELKLLNKRLKKQGLEVEVTEAMSKHLEEVGYSAKFGARPLKNAFSDYVSMPLGKQILSGKLPKGKVIADWSGEETTFKNNDKS